MKILMCALGCLVVTLSMVESAGAQPPWFRDMPPELGLRGPSLGVLVEAVPFARLDALQLPYGVRVSRVFPGSPAQRGGLQPGDIILELNGEPVYSVERLRWLVGKAASTHEVEIQYYRDGDRSSTRIDLRAPEQGAAPVPRQRPPAPGWYSASYLGVGLQPLTPGLREAFSVPDGIGVLIAEVYRDSPAARSGLAAGDTIVRMDRRTISSIPDVYRVLDYFEPGEEIEIEVIREGERQSLRVTLGERDVPAAREYGENWPSPRSGEPFFDPRWWEGIDEFLQRWRDYFEQERRGSPPAAL